MPSGFSGSLAATLFAGGVPAALVFVALLTLRRRYPLMRALGLPSSLLAFALGVAVANVLGLGDMDRGGGVLVATVWFFVIVVVIRGATYFGYEVLLKRQWDIEVPPLLPRVTRFFIYAVSGVMIVSVAFPNDNLGPLLATSAVTSLVLGLALQPILTNFFAGVVIALERPFRINDWIQVGPHEGRVTQITWRTTSIRTRQNDTVIFPNANMARETLTNYLYPHPLHMSRIYVGAHFSTPPHKVKAAMLAAANQVEGVLDRPSAEVYLSKFDESSITYELRAWVDDMGPLRRIESALRTQIWEQFRRNDIVIPFPIRTLEIAPRGSATREPRTPPPARLVVSEGPGRGDALELADGEVVVGRDPECDLVISDPAASKRHLSIVWEDEAFHVRDLDSIHGTRLNGEPVDTAPLSDFDKLQIGAATLVIEIDD